MLTCKRCGQEYRPKKGWSYAQLCARCRRAVHAIARAFFRENERADEYHTTHYEP